MLADRRSACPQQMPQSCLLPNRSCKVNGNSLEAPAARRSVDSRYFRR
jgi:hypothetical protein